MKRSAMPGRSRPMTRGTGLRRAGTFSRVALAASRHRTGFDRATKALVRARDGVCQGCGATPAQAERRGLRLEVHHRLPSGRGGPDTASNGLLICGLGNLAGCHRRVDHERLTWALPRGLALPTGADPRTVPIVDHLDRAWDLHDDGTRHPTRSPSA